MSECEKWQEECFMVLIHEVDKCIAVDCVSVVDCNIMCGCPQLVSCVG